MSQTADVSVIIAAYNAADTVEAAIASALGQEGVAVEVVVVDDASRDGTARVAAGVADPRVRVIARAMNAGPGAARNCALAAASGHWVAVLDADDTFAPGRLARMVERAKLTGADVVVDNLLVVGGGAPERAMFPARRLARMEGDALGAFVAGNNPFSADFTLGYVKPLLRRSALERHGVRYDEALRIGEDYIFLAELFAHSARCAVDPSAGYRYVRHAGSISAVLDAAHIDAMLCADDRLAARSGACDRDARVRRAFGARRRALLRARAFVCSVEALKRRDPAAAVQALRSSPRALWHFRFPIMARLARPMGRAARREAAARG